MFHMPGLKGGINHTYGGEIDVRPTLFNLLGISNAENRNTRCKFDLRDVIEALDSYGKD